MTATDAQMAYIEAEREDGGSAMTPTKEEREDAAYRLRQAAKWSYVWLNDQTMRELTGMEPSRLVGDWTLGECIDSTREIFRHLADLIDPTCKVEGSEPLYMDDETEFRLSCGHVADMVTDCPPAFCPECGARVVDDEQIRE